MIHNGVHLDEDETPIIYFSIAICIMYLKMTLKGKAGQGHRSHC